MSCEPERQGTTMNKPLEVWNQVLNLNPISLRQ